MHLATQFAQPVGDRARAARRQYVKLLRDAAVHHRRDRVSAAYGLVDHPEHLGQEHRKPAVAHDTSEPRHAWRDPRNLVHDDYTGTIAASPDGLCNPIDGDFVTLEVFG
jgi:hypothetical protein